MKRESNELFQLIHSLTRGEKRFFSLSVATYETEKGNRYLALFNAINDQKSYDEAALKQKFSGDPFLGKHFKKAKSSLHRGILAALQRVHRDDFSEVNDLVHQSRILFRKGLHVQSRKVLGRAKKIAEEKEYFSGLIEASEQERSIVAVNRAHSEYWAQQIPVMIQANIDRLKNLHDIRRIEGKVFGFLARHHVLRTAFQRKQLLKLGNELFKPAPEPLSGKAAAILYNTMGTYHRQLGRFSEARTYFRKVREHFDNPRNESEAISYAMISSNIVSSSIDLQDYDDARSVVRMVQQVSEAYPGNQRLTQVQCNLFHSLMSMYIASGQFLSGIDFAESVRKKYFSDAILRDKILFAYNKAVLYFGVGKFRQVMSLMNEVIAIPVSEHPIPKLAFWSRLVQLLAIWEMEDFDLMGHRIKSFHLFNLRYKNLHKLEQVIFDAIRKQFLTRPEMFYEGKTKRMLIEIREKVLPIYKSSRISAMPEYFDFLSWLEAKIAGKTFGDMIKNKAGK